MRRTIRLREPGERLLAWARAIQPNFRKSAIFVELTDWVERRAYDRSTWAWYNLLTGEKSEISQSYRPFEIEPNLLLVRYARPDLTFYFSELCDDADVNASLEVARDALLEGREQVATRLARGVLPHGWPFFVTLVRRERNVADR